MHAIRAVLISSAVVLTAVSSHAATALAQQATQQQSSETQFRAWLKSLETSGAKINTAKIEYDRDADIVKVTDLVISSSTGATEGAQSNPVGTEMHVDTLRLKSFAIGADGVRFGSATADNISVGGMESSGDQGLKFARLDISETFLPTLTSFSSDASRPISSQVAFLRLLTKATLKTVGISGAQFGADLAFDGIALSDIANGKIEKADLTKMHVDLQPVSAGEQGEQTLQAASIVLEKIDIDPYLRLFEKSAYLEAGSSKPWKNLIGAANVISAKLTNGTTVVDLGSIVLNAFKVRQFDQELTDVFDRAAIDPNFITQDRDAALRITNAVRNSFAFDKIGVSEVNIFVPNREGQTKITLSNGTLSNLTSARVDGVGLEQLSLSDNGGEVIVGKLDLREINLPEPIDSIDGTAPTIPTVGRVTASNFSAKLGATQFAVKDLDLAMSYFIGAVPTNARATVDHLKFAVDQINATELRDTLKGLAYDDVDLSLKLSGAWQDSASAIAFDNISIQGVDMGTIQLSGSLKGITRASFQDPQNKLPQEVASGGIQNLRLSFTNDTLFERFMKEAARQNNKSEEELKRILSTNMSAIMSQIEQPAVRNKFTLAAVSFINNPKVLDILTTTSDVTPIQSIVDVLAQPYRLPGLLKLDASANGRR